MSYKCKQCKKQIRKGVPQCKRRSYRILKNKEGKKCGKEIVKEKGVCPKCYNKYGEVMKK